MLAAFEILPLSLHSRVVFELEVALGEFQAVANVEGKEIGEEQGVDAFALIFGLDGHEHEVDDVVLAFDGLEQPCPSQREEASAALLEGAAERWHRDSDADELVLAVDDDADIVELENAEIHVDIIVDLLRSQRRVAVQLVVGLVDELEEGQTVVGLDFRGGGIFEIAQAETLPDDIADAHHLLGHLVGHCHPVFHPIDILLVAEAFEMARIVGVVVDRGHSAELVEAFDEHPLVIHVAESHRADYLLHSALARPVFDGAHHGVDNGFVVDEVDKAEAGFLAARTLVGQTVDYGRHTSGGTPVGVCHEGLGLAMVERRIFGGHKSVDLVEHQRRNVAVVAAVEVDGELHGARELFLCRGYGPYLD